MQKNIKRDFGTVRKLSPGKYLLRVSDGFDDYGKRRQPSKTVYCSCDREAERELIAFYYEVKNNAKFNLKGAPATLSELYEEWFNNHVSTLEETTQKYYKNNWKNIELYGRIKLENCKSGSVRAGIRQCSADGKTITYVWALTLDKDCNWRDFSKYFTAAANCASLQFYLQAENLNKEASASIAEFSVIPDKKLPPTAAGKGELSAKELEGWR